MAQVAQIGLDGQVTYIEEALPDLTPPVTVLDTPPVQIACVLQATVTDGDVSTLGGSYRVGGMMLLDVGTVLAFFTQNLGEAVPFAASNNGVCMSVSEWGGDYAIIEIREQAGGSLVTPSTFGFSLYNI